MLDPIQEHALRLCLRVFRTSPSSSLCKRTSALHVSIQYCLRLSSTSQKPAVESLIANLNHHLIANQIKFPLWELEFSLSYRHLAGRKTLYSTPFHQHQLGSSIALKSITVYIHFIKTIPHLKSSDITSTRQTITSSLFSTLMDPKLVIE